MKFCPPSYIFKRRFLLCLQMPRFVHKLGNSAPTVSFACAVSQFVHRKACFHMQLQGVGVMDVCANFASTREAFAFENIAANISL